MDYLKATSLKALHGYHDKLTLTGSESDLLWLAVLGHLD